MPRIPDDVIEQVRDAADLLEIVQEQVPLKRTGSDWRGACPFHGGAHRNFAVIPRQNRYYCFVCHASGDVFTWYRDRFGMDYPTAVREVARRYGVPIPESSERSGPDPREPLFQACDAAQTWFAAQLRDLDEAEAARRYLVQREFSLDVAATLGLGYAPRGAAFLAAMKQLGIGDEVVVDASLATRRDDGTLAPRFRGRLLFPIHDVRGRVVAFGGRLLGAGEPKYLNSSESPIFHKGEQLYHLHVARNAIRKAGFAIVVEGYFDVQRLALAGLEHVVAPLGTALTEAQAALLKRYTSDVVLLYDSDTPGLKATFRGGDTLLAAGLRVRVSTMPPGHDPDTLAQRGGAAAIEEVVGDAVDVLERKVQLLDGKGWFDDMHRRREALDRLLPTLRAPTDPITREMYITRVAERLAIPRETIAAETASKIVAPSTGSVQLAAPERRAVISHERRRAPGAEIERKLLRLVLFDRGWLDRARAEIDPDWFTVSSYRAIFAALCALSADAPIGDALAGLDARSRDAWQQLVDQGVPGEGYKPDLEYAGALQALNEIHRFPDIAAESDAAVRQQRRSALTKEGQARYMLYLASRSRPRAGRGDSPAEE
jgi:DNA primase